MVETTKQICETTRFVAIGVSCHSASFDQLEEVGKRVHNFNLALREIHRHHDVDTCLILSTCNRIEVYATCQNEEGISAVEKFFRHWFCSNDASDNQLIYKYQDQLAVEHLFKVTSGLDSMVVGENQIVGQVKEAYENLCLQIKPDANFDRWFRKSFSVAKQVRTETNVASRPVSVASVAVKLALKIFDSLKGKRVLIVGAGEMSELVVSHMKSQDVDELIICNRTYSRGVALAEKIGASAIHFDRLETYLTEVEIVVVSVGGESTILSRDQIARIMPKRRWQPLFLMDLGLPRNIDTSVNDIEAVYAYDLADLKAVADSNMDFRKEEAERAFEIIRHNAASFIQQIEKRRFEGVVRQLKLSFEEMIAKEIDHSLGIDESASVEEREQVRVLARRVAERISRKPAHFLTNCSDDEARALIEAFGINDSSSSEQTKLDSAPQAQLEG